MPVPSADPREPSPITLTGGPTVPDRSDPLYWLDRAGLRSLAAPLGEALRPFAWLGAQALLVLQPGFSLLGAGSTVARLAEQWAALDAPTAPNVPVTEEEPCR